MSLQRDGNHQVTGLGRAAAAEAAPLGSAPFHAGNTQAGARAAPASGAAAPAGEPSAGNGLRQQLTWQNALGQLRKTQGRLRELRDKGSVRVQRVLGMASTLLPPTPLGALCGVADTFPLTAENVMLGY